MFGKEKSPYKRRDTAQKKINKLNKKRDKLDKKKRYVDDYEGKRTHLTRSMAVAISDRNLAEYEIKHKKVPTYQDNSKRTTVKTEVHFGSDNKQELGIHGHYHSGNKSKNKSYTAKSKSKTSNRSKKNNESKFLKTLKLIGLGLLGILIIAGIIALAVVCCK